MVTHKNNSATQIAKTSPFKQPETFPQKTQDSETSSSVFSKITNLISEVVVSTTSSSSQSSIPPVVTPFIPATTTGMLSTGLQSSVVWTPPAPGSFATTSYVFATSSSFPVAYTPPRGASTTTLMPGGSLPQQTPAEKPSVEKLLTSMEGWSTATGMQTETLKKAVKMYECETVNCLDVLQSQTSSLEKNNYLAESIVVHRNAIKALLVNSATTTDSLRALKAIVSGYDKVMPRAYATRTSEPSNYEFSVIIASLTYGFMYSHLDKDSYSKVTDGIHPQQYVLEAINVNTQSKNSSGLKNVLDTLFAFLR
jgi:hypothetical protein